MKQSDRIRLYIGIGNVDAGNTHRGNGYAEYEIG